MLFHDIMASICFDSFAYLLLIKQCLDKLTGSLVDVFNCEYVHFVEVLRLDNPMGSCRARSVCLNTLLLARLSPLSS